MAGPPDPKKEPLKVSVGKTAQGRAIMRVEGAVDFANFIPFEAAFKWFGEQGLDHLVVDMAALTYISSPGIGLLIKAQHECARRKGSVVLVRPPALVLNILKVVGLTELFRLADTLEDALKA